MISNIIYNSNTLFVNVEGNLNKKNIRSLKKKVFSIVSDYDVSNMILDLKKVDIIDRESLGCFMDEYDSIYGGNMNIIE